MRTRRQDAIGCVFGILLATAPVHAQPASDELTIRFAPGLLEPPPGRTAAPLKDFTFHDLHLRDALEYQGVERLARLFPRFTPADRFTTNLIGEPVVLEDLSEFYLATLRIGMRVDADLRLRVVPGVVSAGWPQLRRASFIPNDRLFPKQWGLHNSQQQLCGPIPASTADINAPEAWDIETGLNPSVRVGIIDSGIRESHWDFAGRVQLDSGITFVHVQPQWPCTPPPIQLECDAPLPSPCDLDDPYLDPDDDLSHGTGVAGIVAASGDNNCEGVAGVAWGIGDVRVLVSGKQKGVLQGCVPPQPREVPPCSKSLRCAV